MEILQEAKKEVVVGWMLTFQLDAILKTGRDIMLYGLCMCKNGLVKVEA